MSSDALNFQKLTPITNAELGVYGKALDFVFSNNDIKNIAISGAYSAGKSSIIETYKKNNPKKFLHISLAHFETLDAEEKEIKETALEGKILNQLIHQIRPCQIPQTNFRVKRDISSWHVFLFTISMTIFIMSLAHNIFFERWSKYIKEIQSQGISNWLFSFLSNNESLLFSGSIIALLGFIFVYKLVSFFLNQSTFRKVNVQGTEIEIFKESDDSFFDKYLNEVLYLFENSEVDVVVFEDIDRFNSNQIFERLREVNFLINKYNSKKSKSILRFFYLLRDDIFISKDRTKFFDFMIPVIPIIDGTNSYDSLLSIVIESRMQDTFTQNFLQGISLYIDDMRILKNIFNEFLVYKEKLDTIELNPNKLLAIISYKNIFPRDFSDLQLGKGFVANLFINKDKFVNIKIEKLKEEIVETQKIIKSVENEHLQSITEISLLYKDRLENSRRYSHATEEYQRLSQEIEKRKTNLEIKNKDLGNALKIKISNLNERILEIYSKKLSEIITRENIDSIFQMVSVDEINRENNYMEIKGNEYFPLLKYLIRNGYLDETYTDYMTYFHEKSLSKGDKTFLRSIADKQAKDFSYNLRDASKVISRLSVFDFDQAEVLNFDLLEHLLRTSTHRQYLNRIIGQLKAEKNYIFILGYFEQNRQRGAFTRELNSHWPELFSLMFDEGNFSNEIIREFSLLTIYNASDEVINKVNLNAILTQYISKNSSYFDIDNPKIDRIISVFKNINVSFISLKYRELYKDIFLRVYSNDLYVINFDNISVILENLYDAKSEKDIKTKNFSLIYRNKNSPLYRYILNGISDYIDMLINLKTTFIDDEEAFIFILNNGDIEIENKVAYIYTSSTVVLDITRIESKELWEHLLSRRNVFPYSKNVISYFLHTLSYDEYLLVFINGCNKEIDFSDHARDDIIQKFFNATVICNELNNDKYLSILKQVRYVYKTNPPDGINKDKIDILIELQILKMTKNMLIAMRETYPDNIAKFVLYNIIEYVDIVDEEIFSSDEMLIVLSSHADDKYKLSLLELEKEAVSIFQYKHSEDVIAYIITNNLELSEIQNIFDSYTKRSKKLKNIICDMLEDNIDAVYKGKYTIPIQLYDDMFARNGITVENKMKLFASLLPKLDKVKCKFYLQLLSFVDFSDIFTNKRPRFPVNDVTEQILKIFKKKLWIRNFYVDNVDAGIFRVSKSKIY